MSNLLFFYFYDIIIILYFLEVHYFMRIIRVTDTGAMIFHRTEEELLNTTVAAIYVAHLLHNISDGDVQLLTHIVDDLSIYDDNDLLSTYGEHSLPFILVKDAHKVGVKSPTSQISLVEFKCSKDEISQVTLHYEDESSKHLSTFSSSVARIFRYWFDGKM